LLKVASTYVLLIQMQDEEGAAGNEKISKQVNGDDKVFPPKSVALEKVM